MRSLSKNRLPSILQPIMVILDAHPRQTDTELANKTYAVLPLTPNIAESRLTQLVQQLSS